MHRIAIVILSLLLITCKKQEIRVCETTSTLRQVADFPIGTTYDDYQYQNSPYSSFVSEHFSRLSTENLLKMDQTVIRSDSFYFDDLARHARNASNAGIQSLHIHPVVWHKQVPEWLENENPNNLKSFLAAYCSAYRKKILYHNFLRIDGIDVVNEALNEDGTFRNNLWFKAMGKEYINLAYQEFSSLPPEKKLFYNDYNLESNPVKLDAALDLCDMVRKQGHRVDGIGLQMHISVNEPSLADIAQAVEKIIHRGYMVHFSEIDISLNPNGQLSKATPELLQLQAERYYELVALYQQIPKKYQYGITFWGLSDAVSWIPQNFNRFDAPLLFDQNYEAKPAYCSCLNALNR